jgi:hypothetical protein
MRELQKSRTKKPHSKDHLLKTATNEGLDCPFLQKLREGREIRKWVEDSTEEAGAKLGLSRQGLCTTQVSHYPRMPFLPACRP